MQLQLLLEERQLIIDVVERRNCQLKGELARTGRREYEKALKAEQQYLEDIETKLVRNLLEFSADELDTLAAELGQYERELLFEIARTESRDLRRSLQHKERTLQRVRDKVTEACAMA